MVFFVMPECFYRAAILWIPAKSLREWPFILLYWIIPKPNTIFLNGALSRITIREKSAEFSSKNFVYFFSHMKIINLFLPAALWNLALAISLAKISLDFHGQQFRWTKSAPIDHPLKNLLWLLLESWRHNLGNIDVCSCSIK